MSDQTARRSPGAGRPEPRILQAPIIPREALDGDALAVVRRLQDRGHKAYLVGGCVRGPDAPPRPKDFDIATSARPRQVKALFRNCRIIGRRFKLAHLHFGSKILEVSTFRATPDPDENGGGGEEQDLLIRRDNVFGTAWEDARRRDFTVNGLFYEPGRHCILDWVGGLADLARRRICTIGEPVTRFQEDPVRILRAVKFATRLGFEIEPSAWQAMGEVSPELVKSAPPRLLEEILRLLRSRTALARLPDAPGPGCPPGHHPPGGQLA